MYNETDKSRDYLLSRIREIHYSKQSDLSKLFNISVDNTPKNYADLIAKIKGGEYTLDEKATKRVDAKVALNEGCGYSVMTGIIWTGTVTADEDGFHTASVALAKAYTDAKDSIVVKDPKDGLADMKTFEAWTYVAPTVQ